MMQTMFILFVFSVVFGYLKIIFHYKNISCFGLMFYNIDSFKV